MPLASTLAGLRPPLSARLGDDPPGDGWLDCAGAARDERVLDGLLEDVGAVYDTDRRDIMGTRVIEIWTWMVAAPAAATLLTARRLPDLRAANVLIDPTLYAVALRRPTVAVLPGDPAAGHPDARVVADEAALAAELNRALADAHLAPLVATLNRMTRRPARALWRSAADRVADAFLYAGEQLGRVDEAHALAVASLRDAPAPLRARVERRVCGGEPMHVRDGCCLYWRTPSGERCVNCPLLGDDERAEMRAALRAQAG